MIDSKEILAVHSMLHLLFHRNKNQHRRAKWWKWLSVLKRTTGDLARSLDNSPSETTRTAANSSRQHLATHVIPRCYLAFSTVVADNQFSTLGIVLLAALARLAKVTGIDRELSVPSRNQPKKTAAIAATAKEDLGERVCRGGDDGALLAGPGKARVPTDSRSNVVEEPAETRSSLAKSAKETKTNTKTKKRKKNAIDDLFSGLL